MNGLNEYDVVVLGGVQLVWPRHWPLRRYEYLIIERENRLGGILKQCIHDGFGLIKFKEKLTGPEYAQRYVDKVLACQMPVLLSTFVLTVEKAGTGFVITLVNAAQGVAQIETRALILATGCRKNCQASFYKRNQTGGSIHGGYSPALSQYRRLPARQKVRHFGRR